MRKNKIKIAFVINSIKNNGPSNVLISIIKSIDKNNYEPILISLFDENDTSLIGSIKDLHVKVYELKLKNRLSSVISGPEILRRMLDNNSIDLIHTHGFIPDLISSRIHTRIKKVSTIHNIMKQDYINTYGKLKGNIFTLLHLNALKNIDRVVGCSKAVTSSLNKNGIQSTTINNGIPDAKIDENIQRSKLGLSDDSTVLIYAGNLSSGKNITWLAEQFERVHGNNEYLLILGKGDCEKNLIDKSNSNIITLGFVENVNNYMAISDIYVSASKSEGLPLSVLQAMSNGLYLLLSNIPSHGDIIAQNEKCGLLFNVDDFPKKYKRAVENLKKINRSNIIKIQANNYSETTMGKGYSKIYMELLK